MSDQSFHLSFHTAFTILSRPFAATLITQSGGTLLAASWEDPDHPVGLCDLGRVFHCDLSALKDWDIALTKAQFAFVTGKQSPLIDFLLVSERYGNVELAFKPEQQDFSLTIRLPEAENHFDCCKLPLLGLYCQSGDCLELRSASLQYIAGEISANADASLTLWGKELFNSGEHQTGIQSQSSVKWFQLDKSAGPITLHRVGFGMNGQFLDLLLDISFLVGPVTLETMGLTVSVPVDLDFSRTTCSIEGVSIDYVSGPITLGGGLVHTSGEAERYDGLLKLTLPGISMSAMASYAVTDSEASLFIYGYLGAACGGFPSFEITGFAAGFGTNRRLLLPDIRQVSTFPLVDMAVRNQPVESTGEMLRAMQNCLQIEKDSYFGAAGVSFRAFGLIDGVVLITVSFGKRFELALMGLCQATVPNNGKAALAKLVLPFLVRLLPEEGFFAAEAMLDTGSYLLDPGCHLTGGFAFYLWFGGAHPGDFVITMGGYHPRFQKPAHYPSVDRLGVSWQIDSHLLLKGDVYFALTPAAVMAGGALSLTFQAGKLRAWVTAQADFLIQWAPVYYDIEVGVSVGASYRVDLLFIHHTFSIELGASLLLKGPPFYGKVHIKWCIISFTISFGKESSVPPALSWAEFCQNFLPEPAPTFTPESGLEQLEGDSSWSKPGTSFSLRLDCKLPVTALTIAGEAIKLSSPSLGIRPMALDKLVSTLNLEIQKDEGEGAHPVRLTLIPLTASVPTSLWGTGDGDPLSSGLIDRAVTGFQIASAPTSHIHVSPCYLVAALLADLPVEERELTAFLPQKIEGKTYSQADAMTELSRCVSPDVEVRRCNLLQTLKEEGFSFLPCQLDDLSAHPQQNLRCPPELATIGAREENI